MAVGSLDQLEGDAAGASAGCAGEENLTERISGDEVLLMDPLAFHRRTIAVRPPPFATDFRALARVVRSRAGGNSSLSCGSCVPLSLVRRRVLIVQHAEKQRLPGDPGLTALGTVQADTTSEWLQAHQELVAVWTSPLRRAVETAAPIARMAGRRLVTDTRLRERMNWDDPAVQSFEAFVLAWRLTSEERAYVPRWGDSSRAAADRFLQALGDLVGSFENGTAAVVAHGGVTVDALRNLLGDDQLRRDAPHLIDSGVPSCAITTLGFDGDSWTVDRIPSVVHLQAASRARP